VKTLLIFLFATFAMGQNKVADQGKTLSKEEASKLQATMPSKEEISELLTKADEKVCAFEMAVRNAKPYLDKVDTKYAANFLDAASTAHTLIQNMNKNGPSAYGLVGVLATLDDLSLDAANGTVFLLAADEDQTVKGKAPNMGTRDAVIALNAAGTACHDISELIFHATMRFIGIEERLLDLLPH
jgi:hypothetical protein